MSQQTLFDVGQVSDVSDTPAGKVSTPTRELGNPKNDLPGNLDKLTKGAFASREPEGYPPVRHVRLSDTPQQQQLTSNPINPGSIGTTPHHVWLAWCQQCELKQPFTDYTDSETWVKTHRQRYGHRVQHGAGKI